MVGLRINLELHGKFTSRRLIELTTHEDKEKAKRAFDAMLKMKKINISDVENAFKGSIDC